VKIGKTKLFIILRISWGLHIWNVIIDRNHIYRPNFRCIFSSNAALASSCRATRWQMYFLSAILQRILVNGKTAGDGKVTGTVIDFLLTGYFAERITTNAFWTCRLLQRGIAMNRGIYAHNYILSFTVCTFVFIWNWEKIWSLRTYNL